MKVIIAGGREFNDYESLSKYCDFVLSNLKEDIEVVSGECRGADKLGEKYAKERGYDVKPFPADWDKYKKAAGHIRNEEMAKYADALIAFWDGESKGTKGMIDLATKYGLKVKIKLWVKK